MDHDAFEAWLGAIGGMTVEQRSLGFRALALAEAGDDPGGARHRQGDSQGRQGVWSRYEHSAAD